METLPDYIQPGLRILSIGLNPSIGSVQESLYFAGKQNRFWKALLGSGLINQELPRTPEAMSILLNDYKIGFTDVVKRPTAGVADLCRADYVKYAPQLQDKIGSNKPLIAWFHGKVAYKQYLSVLKIEHKTVEWGLQDQRISESVVFVSPNPSSANATFSLIDITIYYRELKLLHDRIMSQH